MRIYPHLQDSGGFFVAVIERTKTSRQASSTEPKPSIYLQLSREEDVSPDPGHQAGLEVQPSEASGRSNDKDGEPPSKRQKLVGNDELDRFFEEKERDTLNLREVIPEKSEGIVGETGGQFKEDPYTFISPTNPILSACMYVLSPSLFLPQILTRYSDKLDLAPTFPRSNLFVRNPDGAPVRALYLVNDAVKATMDATDYKRMRLVSAGVKLFGRSELGAASRFTSNASAQDTEDTAADSNGEASGEAKKGKKLEFRVLNDGLLALLPHLDISKLVVGGPSALRVFLESYYPLCTSFEDGFNKNLAALGALFLLTFLDCCGS